jgi:hypothetical protein
MFVYICIDVGDPVEGRVGMPLTGSLMFVYVLILAIQKRGGLGSSRGEMLGCH